MSASFTLRHRCFHRTRLQFVCLKNNPALCRQVENELHSFPGIDALEARPRSGSLILLHFEGFSALEGIIDKVELLEKTVGTGSRSPFRPLPAKEDSCRKRYHVSGLTLLVSGAYLLYLSLKRLLLPLTPVKLLQLPVLVTLRLAWPVQRQSFDNLKATGRPDMGLISTALLYYSLLVGNVLTAYTIFWLFNLSSWLESHIQRRTRQTIREMLLARSGMVWLLEDGVEIETEASTLQPGDRIVLRLGDIVPIDGVICQGHAFLDESMLTGESRAVLREEGAQVLSGTVVRGGEIVVEAEKTGEETRLAGIVRIVESAENDPGELQRLSLRISRGMFPVSLGIAAVGFLFTGNMMQALALLVITCPCALRLSSSVTVSSTMAASSREGILVKGGRYLELAARMDTLIVDKTGTLTVAGEEEPTFAVLDRRLSGERLLQLAASLQRLWPHPAGRRLLEMAEERGLELLPLTASEYRVGGGVRAEWNGEPLLLGSEQFLEQEGVVFSSARRKIVAEKYESGSRLFLARKNECVAFFSFRQRLRHGVEEALAALRASGIERLVLLSGDSAEGVAAAGASAGFDEVLSGQTPEQKAEWIAGYRHAHPEAVIGMVGDGINDTPAFAAADISFAVADGGSEVTVEYGDVVLQYGGVEKVARLYDLAVDADRTVKRSYAMAIGLNSLALAGTVAGVFSPLAGALLHNGVTVMVVGYAAGRRTARDK